MIEKFVTIKFFNAFLVQIGHFLILDIFRQLTQMLTQVNPKIPLFSCQKCDYVTCHKNDFTKHCNTIKHRVNTSVNPAGETVNPCKDSEIIASYSCEYCKKGYFSYVGMWKHSKKCQSIAKSTDQNNNNNLMDYLIKENKDLKDSLVQRDDDFKKLIIEICKRESTVNTAIAINSNNNNNNTFNLNLFLNETCKDALNLSDFIKSVKVSFEDIEKIGSAGYVDGTSEVIIKHLNNLGVEKRPIQCTDAKRQTLYIKEDDQWTKEDANLARLQRLVDEVQRINLRQLPLWREKHPACLTSNSIHTSTYNNMSQELMGGDCSNIRIQTKDQKIINKIIKEVVVDKQMFFLK